DRDEAARLGPEELFRQVEIAERIPAQLRAWGGGGNLLQRSRSNMSADRRPQRQEKRHRRQPVILLAAVEVAVEHAIGEMPEPAMFQIHQQKREVVENVDAGEGLVELEAIEKGGLPIEQTDIAEV